ncbi:MAG: proline dehydrogenase family protein [Caldilineaceae bacterium]|nr:proline dehydrogenase family protein [Caldilineaceae bacterium]
MTTSHKHPVRRLVQIGLVAGGGFLAYRYGEQALRKALLYLSGAGWARRSVTELPVAWRVAGRFIAGESIDDAVVTTRRLNDEGLLVTLDLLGESVATPEEAMAARDQILDLLERIHTSRIDANVSIKPSQLGIKLDRRLCLDNLRELLIRARQYENRVRIDMEDSSLVDVTLDMYRTLRFEDGFDNVGVVIQSYLYRSEADVARLVEEGAWVRLVKGAYLEPPAVAFPDKADVDANFIRLMQGMLSEEARENGVELAVASHDEVMIQATIDYATRHAIPADAYEFQLLHGIRRDLQMQLRQDGHRVRIYVPYGVAWYPYFMRRLAERPANLWFFASNLLRG